MEGEQPKSPEKREKYNTTVINRNYIKNNSGGFNVSSEYLDTLELKVKEMVKESILRASGNRRSTLLARDL